MKKENNTAAKRPLWKKILYCALIILAILIIIYPIFFYLMMKYGTPFEPKETRCISALGSTQAENAIAVSRTTTLDFWDVQPIKSEYFETDGYYANRNVQVADVYVLRNYGT